MVNKHMTKIKKIEKVLKALANHRRLEILNILRNKKEDITVGEIAEGIKLSFKSTSRHLAVLSAAEIVTRDQINLHVYYKISPDASLLVRQVLSYL